MQNLKCTCGQSFRSASDYKMAMLLKMDIEEYHGLMDLWEETVDEVLTATSKMDQAAFDAYIEEAKKEYEDARQDVA